MISPHRNLQDHKDGWYVDHDVIPTCQNCVWHRMDSCIDNGDTVSVLGDEQGRACNIEAIAKSTQNDIKAVHTDPIKETNDAENVTLESGAEGESEYRRDNKPSTSELVSYENW